MNETIADRIDALPLSREHWRILLLAGVAWLIESYDIGIIGNALPVLKRQYTLSSFTVGLMVAASTLGIVAAVLPGGWLTDQVGRKPMLVAGTAWYALFTLATGFADTPHIILCRPHRTRIPKRRRPPSRTVTSTPTYPQTRRRGGRSRCW